VTAGSRVAGAAQGPVIGCHVERPRRVWQVKAPAV